MKKNKNSGFTLLEVILSIATISLVSVFILEMFVVSNRVNKKASDIDNANMICLNAVESFKSGDTPGAYFYEESYDAGWNATGAVSPEKAFILTVNVSSGEPDIYGIDASVKKTDGEEVASLSALKYFAPE